MQSKYKTLNDNGMTQVYKKKQQSERIRNDNGMTQVYKKKQQSERTRNDNGMTHVYREKHPTFSLGLLRSDLVPASFQSVSDSEASIERHRNEDGGPNERNENEEGADCGSFWHRGKHCLLGLNIRCTGIYLLSTRSRDPLGLLTSSFTPFLRSIRV